MQPEGAVAAGHPRTAEAAETILLKGGNAFDAVLAAMCAACVAEPCLASLGGGGFLLARPACERARVYDFFGQTPRKPRPPAELDFTAVEVDFGAARQTFHIGLGSVATPGVVRGLFEIQRELGSIPMQQVVAPAVALAQDGVEVNPFQAGIFALLEGILTARASSRALFATGDAGGPLPREGDRLRLPELGDTLEQLALEGDDLFYRGEIARRIVRQSREGGGGLRREDLAGYRVERREPLTVDYRNARVYTNPPPASGGALMAFALKLLEAAGDVSALPFGSLGHLRLLAEIMERTNAARADLEASGADGARQLDRLLHPGLLERYRREVLGRARSVRGTTHMNVVDRAGNIASLSLSNGEGCGEIVPGAGFMLNNLLGEEDLLPEGFHRWTPNQRMTSMMSPTIVERPNGAIIATGSGGSKRIRTVILQLLVNLIDHGMDVTTAVSNPRVFVEGGRLSIEGGFDPETVRRLVRHYPDHDLFVERNLFFGGAHTVERHCDDFRGAGDVRRGGVYLLVRR